MEVIIVALSACSEHFGFQIHVLLFCVLHFWRKLCVPYCTGFVSLEFDPNPHLHLHINVYYILTLYL